MTKTYSQVSYGSSGNDVKELMCERGFEDVQVYKDLAGLDRVVTGQWNRS